MGQKGRRKAAPEKEKKVAQKGKTSGIGVARPTGQVPSATVSSRHGISTVDRVGRGFSAGELAKAGLIQGLAKRWAVLTDVRRRSVLESNVLTLKKWASAKPKVEREQVAKVKAPEKAAKRKVTKKKTAE